MKTKERTSFIDCGLSSDARQIGQVCKLIGWSYGQYCNFQFDKYLEYTDRAFMGWPVEMINQIRYSPIFRAFWNEEVSYRNHTEFLPFARYGKGQDVDLVAEFIYIHDPRTLLMDELFLIRYNSVIQQLKGGEQC